jgi:hypothetical protein
VVRAVFAAQTLDRCFVLAAQIMITAVPMLIAVSAFAPAGVRSRILAGLAMALASATSLSRRLPRM